MGGSFFIMDDNEYSILAAYFFWFISGCGALGFHRFYLKKPASGCLYFLTGGFFMIGSVYDFITLPEQVREANIRQKYREALESGKNNFLNKSADFKTGFKNDIKREFKKDTPEKVILRAAKKNNGIATPSIVALESDISLDDAKKQLESLVSKGYAEMRVSTAGVIVFLFPDFVTDPSELDLEDI